MEDTLRNGGAKCCARCSRLLPKSDFNKHPAFADGLDNRCRQCRKVMALENSPRLGQFCALVRVCTCCGQEKPYGKFTRKTAGICYACKNARYRTSLTAAERAESWRRYRERIPTEKIEERRERARIRARGRTAESRRAEGQKYRARRAQIEGKCINAAATKRAAALERAVDALAEKNAREAWRHWVKVAAPGWWLDGYYMATGKPWTDHRLTQEEAKKVRRAHDDLFDQKYRLRKRVKRSMRRERVINQLRAALGCGRACVTVEEALGYTVAELREHLQRQFRRGMTWNNYGLTGWHIDHITPQSAFDLSDPDEWRACWALPNLRPLWARDNLSKSDNRVFLI